MEGEEDGGRGGVGEPEGEQEGREEERVVQRRGQVVHAPASGRWFAHTVQVTTEGHVRHHRGSRASRVTGHGAAVGLVRERSAPRWDVRHHRGSPATALR